MVLAGVGFSGAERSERESESAVRAGGYGVGLRASTLRLDEVSARRSGCSLRERRMRARFAMRFGKEGSEQEQDAVREDVVRAAFNSPFWPFALVSTSVGQEGLDFHSYCHAIVHWNLPLNPVDLEQRGGRIHRFKGHAIRKNVAAKFGSEALAEGAANCWESVFERASHAVANLDGWS